MWSRRGESQSKIILKYMINSKPDLATWNFDLINKRKFSENVRIVQFGYCLESPMQQCGRSNWRRGTSWTVLRTKPLIRTYVPTAGGSGFAMSELLKLWTHFPCLSFSNTSAYITRLLSCRNNSWFSLSSLQITLSTAFCDSNGKQAKRRSLSQITEWLIAIHWHQTPENLILNKTIKNVLGVLLQKKLHKVAKRLSSLLVASISLYSSIALQSLNVCFTQTHMQVMVLQAYYPK